MPAPCNGGWLPPIGCGTARFPMTTPYAGTGTAPPKAIRMSPPSNTRGPNNILGGDIVHWDDPPIKEGEPLAIGGEPPKGGMGGMGGVGAGFGRLGSGGMEEDEGKLK
mmetsp:Transcript_24124/g.60670  ORF Transcript_24124/g.60670 Transcript_24124/m.60670 type:complete len:108 (+) Transcript_24124:205-528(+)